MLGPYDFEMRPPARRSSHCLGRVAGPRDPSGRSETDVRSGEPGHGRSARRPARRHGDVPERRNAPDGGDHDRRRRRLLVASLRPAGQYLLQPALSEFATKRRESLTFNAGQRAVINITLRLSAVRETVTVTGDPPVV